MRLLPALLKMIGFVGQQVAVGTWVTLAPEQMHQKSRMRLVQHRGTLQTVGMTVGEVEHHTVGLYRRNTCLVETALPDRVEERTVVAWAVVVSASRPVAVEELVGS
jgi:hypothetical protein